MSCANIIKQEALLLEQPLFNIDIYRDKQGDQVEQVLSSDLQTTAQHYAAVLRQVTHSVPLIPLRTQGHTHGCASLS